MHKLAALWVLCVLAVASAGCTSLSRSERDDLRLITDVGLSATEQDIKSPTLAGILNILPGIGNFYLAAGTEETHMWAIGAVNLLFWPISVLWGVPEAAIDASTINKKETIYYYMKTERGRLELREAQDRMKQLPPIRGRE